MLWKISRKEEILIITDGFQQWLKLHFALRLIAFTTRMGRPMAGSYRRHWRPIMPPKGFLSFSHC